MKSAFKESTINTELRSVSSVHYFIMTCKTVVFIKTSQIHADLYFQILATARS